MPTRDAIGRALRDPWTLGALAVDLLPAIAVVFFGWGAAPLVILYWLENFIVGVIALLRMLAVGVSHGVGGVIGALALGTFFVVHYGLFWTIHGLFVLVLVSSPGTATAEFANNGPSPDLAFAALQADPYLPIFFALVFAWELLFAIGAIIRGDLSRSDLTKEMFAPYARVVVLHIGIFAGAFALIALGEPAWGILGLILLHAGINLLWAARKLGGERPALQPAWPFKS